MDNTRKCTCCGEEKPLTEYYRKGNGYQSRCKVCDKKHGKDKRRDSEGNYYYINNDKDMKEQQASMEGNVQLFNNGQFSVRIVMKGSEPMFCLADVCKILEIKNPSKAKTRLNENGCRVLNTLTTSEGTSDTPSTAGNPNMTFINEPNVYKLIFQSRKAEAQAFADWVTETILPSIRKNGAYVANQENLTPEEIIRRGYEAITRICEEQKRQLEEQKPKVEYFDALIERDLNINLRDTAHEIGIRQSDFIDYLTSHNYLYRHQGKQLKPFAQHIGELFVLKEYSREQHSGVQTLVTPKGRAYFKRLLTA